MIRERISQKLILILMAQRIELSSAKRSWLLSQFLWFFLFCLFVFVFIFVFVFVFVLSDLTVCFFSRVSLTAIYFYSGFGFLLCFVFFCFVCLFVCFFVSLFYLFCFVFGTTYVSSVCSHQIADRISYINYSPMATGSVTICLLQ